MYKKIIVNSKLKKYEVFFNNNLQSILNKNYNNNDIIIIDKKVFNLINSKILFKKKKY